MRFGDAVDALAKLAGEVDVPIATGETCVGRRGFLPLLQRGADVNAKTSWASTPLDEAIQRNQAPMVQLLLDAGAEPRLADGAGESALFLAARAGTREIVEALLERGARHREMRVVDRIERAAKDSDALHYRRIYPWPSTTNFCVVRPSSPTGPRACSLSLEMPISAPRPYS